MKTTPPPDEINNIGNSVYQVGHYNQRVYILHLEQEDLGIMMETINERVQLQHLSKVIAKIPSGLSPYFLKHDYRIEAKIPDYYPDHDAVIFVARYYFNSSRSIETQPELLEKILTTARNKYKEYKSSELPQDFFLQKMIPDDIDSMAKLYQQVFPSYPFPIVDPAYLLDTMKDQVDYFGIMHQYQLVALSSIEKNSHAPTAEMTDFATHPTVRNKGLAGCLLQFMEDYVRKHYRFQVIYTIARAYSYGINSIFSKCGYVFGGTLTNNTNIHGKIESMNIWYKHLQ